MARRTRKSNEDKVTLVKLGRTGGRVEEYQLEGDEPTVGDALTAAGISTTKGDRIRVNGEPVDVDTIVETGDLINVSGKVSGGNR